ncbi:MAG: hypothetical protein B7X86_14245 [Sphingobacteriales bacterium 17-39-43]|uniref:hypothetical protein n=1 Tax=Daejeonella sp. TaxID=2805397 RepID=UPI000BDB17DF|nr:hypothetical protein [Daejeonella sp.]OYZ30109.1 MAG: hypothetical protein B7Y24_14010 [Sphingobacteriales bacterium 16-39-50]OZA22827.1 MAG: hypothetical protein B7X86_14245 [Sphingobacteriales bacterium 17-39-43]HQT24022.1 hypothetical protein [Daejeonella sp.]HQT58686.1 hypothetical protein [Daejeonella sp.]
MKFTFSLTLILLYAIGFTFSQSTSNWIRVTSNSEDIFKETIQRNASYVSLSVVNSKIFHNSNWWSSLIGKNRSAFYTINLSAIYPDGKKVSDRRSSKPVVIEKKSIPIEIGWSQTLVNELPTTFSTLKVDITLGYNSEDGIDKIIGIVSELSATLPPLAPVQASLGAVSGVKLLLDELFNKNLAANYLSSNNEIMASSQNQLQPGYYVIFGEKSSDAYQTFKNNSNKLKWNGIELLYDNNAINNVNYVVILLTAKSKLFPVKDINIVTNTELPWAKFYIEANTIIDNFNSLKDSSEVVTSVREKISAAKGLLDNDPTYIFTEKEDIHLTLRDYLTKKYVSKKAKLVTQPDIFLPIN